MSLTVSQWVAELDAAAAGFEGRTLAEAAGLAEEGRGLARDNAAARVYGPRSGRGTLGDSVRGRAAAGAEVVTVELTAGEPGTPAAAYARAQELGAVIRPRQARFLSIPTDAAARGGILSVRALAAPRWVPRKAGGWLVFQGAVLMFVMHPGPVILPAKRFVADAFDDVLRIAPERLALASLLGLAAA